MKVLPNDYNGVKRGLRNQEAFKLALNATILSQDTITVLVKKAYSEMLSLSMRIDMIKGKSESLIQKSWKGRS